MKRSWDLLSDEERRLAVDEIISFFRNERNEEIGILAAENLLDMFLQNAGIKLYNKGVEDTQNFVKKRVEELSVDIEVSVKK